MKKLFLFFSFLFTFSAISAQVVSWQPLFPTEKDSIVVTFNAALGSQGLKGYTGDVYAHTGVITNLSTGPSDWKYVKTNWGVNTAETKLARIGTDLYRFVIRPDAKSFYKVPVSEKVKQIAFVFRSAASPYKEGKGDQNADIFVPVYEGGMNLSIITPTQQPLFVKLNDAVNVKASATGASKLSLYVNNALVKETANDTIEYSITANEYGKKRIRISATSADGMVKSDSLYFVVNADVPVKPLPSGVVDGINYNGNSVTLVFYALNKQNIYVIGDFNNWEADPAYYMNATPDHSRFWITIDNLASKQEYGFQYLVDGALRIADPYAEKVLDPWNDKYIPASVYPNLKPYPVGKTDNVVSVLQTNKDKYQWEVTDFKKPAKEGLVIYELLVRDFLSVPDYKTLKDTLGYLKRLGINAIELMPINEFEGNLSWGYNPDFYFAPDKYYGTDENLKKFIDECHKNGIAVIIDMVLNHSFGLSPMVRLYWDAANNKPSASNPWFNTDAKHDYNVGFDFNHESYLTRTFAKRVMEYWIKEYKVDGYRFDLSKGFTQKQTLGNVGLWGQYDQSRINIWKDYASKIKSVDSTAYIILEHFADYSEELELAKNGMMLWRNLTGPYGQSTMGWVMATDNSSDIGGVFSIPQNWVAYMESHDEQWLMYKNLTWGNSLGDYNIKSLPTALDRVKLAAAFFFTVPGPKMLWQFEELGYSFNLDSDRTGSKPLHWEYYQDPDRLKLYKTYSAIMKLRNENEVFRSPNTNVSLRVGQGQNDRRINLTHASMNATIIGNFNLSTMSVNPNFQASGRWYEYFTGDSIDVTDTQASIELKAGEYRIYTNKRLQKPDLTVGVEDETDNTVVTDYALEQNYPNPFNPSTLIRFSVPEVSRVTLRIYDILGREIKTLLDADLSSGVHTYSWNGDNNFGQGVSSGIYFYKLDAGKFSSTKKMMLVR